MIPLTLVKINTCSKKSKIKTNVRKVLQRHKCFKNFLHSTSPQNNSCPLFDELLHCIDQQFNNQVANDG